MAKFDSGPALRGVARVLSSALAIGAVIAVTTTAEARPETNSHAGDNIAVQHLTLQKACTAQGGRFERSWTYDDQGVQWGKVVSCSTGHGYITCRADVCRAGRWVKSDGEAVANARKGKTKGSLEFPAEPVAFSAALSVISAN